MADFILSVLGLLLVVIGGSTGNMFQRGIGTGISICIIILGVERMINIYKNKTK